MQPNSPFRLRPVALLGAAAAAAFLCSVPAQAQGLPGGASSLSESHGAWQVACQATGSQTRCALAQSQAAKEGGQRLLAIELATAPEGAATGVVILPFGLKLESGVVLNLDEQPALPTARFSTCLPAGCLVPLSFDAPTVEAMKTATALKLRAVANEGGQNVDFTIALNGFASALARVRDLAGAN